MLFLKSKYSSEIFTRNPKFTEEKYRIATEIVLSYKEEEKKHVK